MLVFCLHEVEVAAEDRWKTAFWTRYGTFNFTVMPFGLSGAPSAFQLLVQNKFMNGLDEFVVIHLGDALMVSKTEDDHERHVQKVRTRMREHRFFVNLSRCECATQGVQYLWSRLVEYFQLRIRCGRLRTGWRF